MRSYVPDFEMTMAKELDEAVRFVGQGYGVFAGGTDIMVLFNAGKFPLVPLVGIRKIDELTDIRISDEFVEIGAAVTYSQLRQDASIGVEYPLLEQAASWTGSIANQNRGTLGGNIANASPAADSSPVLLCYEADLKLISESGERWLPYSEFHLGYKQIALKPGELIGAVRLPRSRARLFQYGRKVGTRRAQAIAKVSIAVSASQNKRTFRIAMGSVAPVPLRCWKTEALLQNEGLSPSVIEQAKAVLASEIAPISDIRSTRDYRLTVAQNLLAEFLERLL